MFNQPPNSPESLPKARTSIPAPEIAAGPRERIETIPNLESIQAVFIELVKGKEYEVTKLKEDEYGPNLWEIKVTEPDGSIIEYTYSREGTHDGSPGTATVINVLFSDETGFPTGGYDAANYRNGRWEIREQ